MDAPTQGPNNPATSNPYATGGADPNAAAFQASLTSPGGAAVEAEGTPGTKSVSVISANPALTDYNQMGTFASQQQAANAQQAAINAANKAAADAAAATKTQTDASTTSNNNLAGAITSATGALNGGTASTTGTTKTTASGNSYTSTGDPYNDQLAAQSADNAAMYAQTQTKLATAATTAGLTPDQQNQLTNLGAQYDSLIKDQQNVNDMTAGQNSMAMARSGGDRYAPAVAASVMSHVMSAGVDQITSIQNKKTSALQQMTSSFESSNVQGVQDAYKAYQDFSTAQNKIITDMQTHLDNVAKDQAAQKAADLNAQKAQMTFNKDNNITSQFYQYPGSSQVFSSQTGQPVTQQEYLAQGGSPDFKSIQVINNDTGLQSTSGKEYEDYLKTLPQGQKPLSFNDYMNMDANRKATRVTNNTVTYNQAKDEAQTQAASVIGTGLAKKAGP